MLEEQQNEISSRRRSQVGTGSRAEKIRTYNYKVRGVGRGRGVGPFGNSNCVRSNGTLCPCVGSSHSHLGCLLGLHAHAASVSLIPTKGTAGHLRRIPGRAWDWVSARGSTDAQGPLPAVVVGTAFLRCCWGTGQPRV